MAALVLLSTSLLAAGCGADERPAEWDYISTVIMEPNCATVSCHSRAAAVAGLDFSDPDRGYTSLMGLKVWIVDPSGTAADGCKPVNGQVVCQRGFRPMVTPYDPEQSRIINMMRGRNAARMPPDRPLPEASIELVERWIRNGALRYPRELSDGAAGDGAAGDGGTGKPSVTVTVTPNDGGAKTDAVSDGGEANDGGAVTDAAAITDGANDSGAVIDAAATTDGTHD